MSELAIGPDGFDRSTASFDVSIGIQLFEFRYSNANLKISTEFFYLKYLTMLFQA